MQSMFKCRICGERFLGFEVCCIHVLTRHLKTSEIREMFKEYVEEDL